MDFGLYLPCYYPEHDTRTAGDIYREAVEQAVIAEELGFHSVSIPEHHFADYITVPSPLILAAAVAQRTSRIKIITSVLVLPFYDMRRLAGEIAQTDQITGGRLELGVARGAFSYEARRMEIPFAEAKARFYEALEFLELLLREEEVTYSGQWNGVAEPTTVMPRPVQDPCPPFWVASTTEEGMRWALERAYDVQSTPLRRPWEAALEMATIFRRLRDELVPDGGPRHHMLRNAYVSKDRADLERKAQALFENDQRFKNLYETEGTVRRGRTQPAPNPDQLPADAAKNVIFGDPEHAVRQVQDHADAGLDGIQLNMMFGMSHDDLVRSLRLFAEEVIPNVQAPVRA